MSIRKRKIEADYLKINKAFVFLGTGWTGLDEKPNAQTKEKRYVNESSSTQTITGYKWQNDFTGDQIQSDEAIEYIASIGKELKSGAEAETEYCKVDLDKPASTDSKSFYARKFKVAIQGDEFPDNDGELGISGSFLGIGDPIIGTFNVETKAFTEGFTGKTLEFTYNATGDVTEISNSKITFDKSENKFKGIPTDVTSFTFKDGGTLKTATLAETWNVA